LAGHAAKQEKRNTEEKRVICERRNSEKGCRKKCITDK
jgi:hypothetical protein